MQRFNKWVAEHERDGGHVVFITSDRDFLAHVQSIKDRPNFSATVLYCQPNLSPEPGLCENAPSFEWLAWLKQELNMPHLRMQPYDEADYSSPPSHGK